MSEIHQFGILWGEIHTVNCTLSCSRVCTLVIISSCSSFFLFLYLTAAALFLSSMVIRLSSGGRSAVSEALPLPLPLPGVAFVPPLLAVGVISRSLLVFCRDRFVSRDVSAFASVAVEDEVAREIGPSPSENSRPFFFQSISHC